MTILALLLATLTAVLVPGGLYLATVESPSSTPAWNAGLQTGPRGAPRRVRRNHPQPRGMYGLERRPASPFFPCPVGRDSLSPGRRP